MTDNYVQIPPASTGLKIDTSELAVNGSTVERQRVVLADPTLSGNFVSVTSGGELAVAVNDQAQYFMLIIAQLKRIALVLETIADMHVSLDDVV